MANNVEGEQPIHFAVAEDAGDIVVLLAKGGKVLSIFIGMCKPGLMRVDFR